MPLLPLISILSFLTVLFGDCKGPLVRQESRERKPNVVFFLVDDLGWTDLSCCGSDLYRTPNVDRLAREGVRFTSNYAACTVCSPTRAAIMTGRYPARIGLTDWISGHKMPGAELSVPDWKMYMDTSEFTLAEAFRAAGYATGHFGKWHLGDEEIFWPEHQGFDVNTGGWGKGQPQRNTAGCNGYFPPYCNPRLKDGPEGEYLTERLAREAVAFIETNRDKPFYLNFWFYNVHTPLQARKELIAEYEALVTRELNHQNPVYAAMVQHMDEAVGKVVGKLEGEGLLDNTIIVFNSDNGGLRGHRLRQMVTSNRPLKQGKGEMYEGGIRVPAIISWKGKIPGGKVINEPVISMDYYPTLTELAGIRDVLPEGQILDGISLVPLIMGHAGKMQRDALFWHYPHYHVEGAVPYSAVRSGYWKLVCNIQDSTAGLYNLAEDIGESNDLSSAMPEKTRELMSLLRQWYLEVDAQMPEKNPDWDKDRADQGPISE